MTDGDRRGGLRELATVIETAAQLAEQLLGDSVLWRLVEAFRLMPLEDRAPIVGAVEREVQARRLSRATEDSTGQSMHPNPHARLYLRSYEQAMPRNILERDELMLAMLSGMRVCPILLVPDIHASWIDGTREALQHLDEGARAAVVTLLREALALADGPEAAAASSDPQAARAS